MQYRVLIIDDEPLARSMVNEYLQTHPQLIVVEECSNGFEGVKAIQQHSPDLIFLDIQMPKISGFEMLELLEEPPAVIFTTAFDEYAVQAFEKNAVDYLLKPFSQQRFDKAISRWMEQDKAITVAATEQVLKDAAKHPAQAERVVVKNGTKITIIPVQDIQYLEAADDYVKIITATGSFLKKQTMSYFEETLNASSFVRTHRSFMVRVQEITRIDPYEKENHVAVLRSGAKIPVSRAGYPKLKVMLGL
ncbi:LytR/AlgR family response regulator transcription factor [Lacibacter sp. H407]|uniref:LytR/AlgR family response regulator transcription factor n=1 Tax=Lacibacter sp. H407 TaxID=3133423 RepID=UPI0030C3FB1F